MSEVDSINPNTPVTSNLTKQGTIEADATGGPLSFDELEEVTKAEKRAKAEKKDEPKDKSKDLTSDTDKGKKAPQEKSEKAEGKKASEKSEKAEGSEEAPTPAEVRKLIKAKYQDSEYDLDEETLVPVKINGKEELVQIKDIVGNYSGKVAWDKKFSELDQIRKSNSTKEMKLKEIEDMVKAVYQEQDPNMKMYRMSMLAGIDPVEFRDKFFNENISLLEKWYGMTEDERRADALSYEANVHKHRADTLEKGIKEKQDFESLQTKVAGLRERHKVSEREFVEIYDHLDSFVKSGQMDPRDLTAEKVIQTAQEARIFNAANTALEKLDLGWDQQTKLQKLSKMTDIAVANGFKPEEMAEMVDELWGVKKAQRKIQEKKKQNEEFLSGKKPVTQTASKTAEPVFFDQM